MNQRRKLMAALGAGALSAPFAARAQAPGAAAGKIWRVGFLALPSRPADLDSHYYGAFRHGMRELGYVEGKNLVIEWRWAEGEVKRLDALAAELVQLKLDLITTAGNDAAIAAQKATGTIPIVMGSSADPVDTGLVASLARPGGNMTGLSDMGSELAPKRLQLLLSMTSTATRKASRVAVLVASGSTSNVKGLAGVQAAGETLGVKILPFTAGTSGEIEAAFSLMRQQKADALIVLLNPVFQQQRSQIAQLAANHRLPSITADRQYPETGSLMSYGPNLADNFRRAATYADKIFKGRKPADLPVEQPMTFELVINGKTAKALGLTIPQELLISAERVIE
jgi:putative ABC transport system substrate-binding protein